jgi:hypothetical protein
MRLYTTTGATQVDDPEFGTFKADANGAFNGLPDAMYAKLHGRPGWENDPERELRITKEELDRFRDPAELLKAVKELSANQGVFASALAQALGIVQAPAPAADAVSIEVPAQAEAPAVKVEAPVPAAEVKPDVKAEAEPEAKTGRRGKATAATEAPAKTAK